MNTLRQLLTALHRDESAVTSTEFIIIFCLIAASSLMLTFALGDELKVLFGDVHGDMSNGEIRGGLSAN